MEQFRTRRTITVHYLKNGKKGIQTGREGQTLLNLTLEPYGYTQKKATHYKNGSRLSAYIFNLRKEGFNIDMERIRTESGITFGLYNLRDKVEITKVANGI